MTAKVRKTPGAETVTIDRDAYDRLEAARSADESLSEVIKRLVRPRRSAAEVLRTLREANISSSTLRSIEASASQRRRRPHRSKD